MPAVLYSWSLLISLRSSNSTVYPIKNEGEKLEKQNHHQRALLLLGIFSNSAFHLRDPVCWGHLIRNFTQKLRKTYASHLLAAIATWKKQLALSP